VPGKPAAQKDNIVINDEAHHAYRKPDSRSFILTACPPNGPSIIGVN
jgi:hypothetical protein